jgi:hypothetical protein
MSADNYYMIRRHPAGGYAAVMGFASDIEGDWVLRGEEWVRVDEYEDPVRSTQPSFPTIQAAFDWATEQYSEYGVSIHGELQEEWHDLKAGGKTIEVALRAELQDVREDLGSVKVQLAQLQADAWDLVEAGDDLSRMLIRLSYSTSALSAADKWVGNPVRQRNRWWK